MKSGQFFSPKSQVELCIAYHVQLLHWGIKR